ncbi:MAG: hypothetical protein JO215_00840 [Ktedonobacteraceae bacterium]|nr:hypothetical protein [Ktedonobacteraceae bacterium]MBV9614208.1 hypothetical protein [Ktedonobacteraceae bacterium]MBV9712707.1 hypothetical protein [Ktedonobacteraceae bacterium]
MDDKTVSTAETTNSSGTVKADSSKNVQTMAHVSSPAAEHRQAYGTAKTENLRDSGLWRLILPAFVIVCCLVLFAIPLVILVPLLTASLDPLSASRAAGDNLVWVWITLIVLSVGIATVVVWGLSKIFLTQAGNYHKV